MATVRYLVSDVELAIEFYTTHLGFALRQQFGPAMAILKRDDLTFWLAGPMASAARPMPDGRTPQPGGWNRIVIEVQDLPALATRMREAGVPFRNEIVDGPGGRQILCEDPSGNVVELLNRGHDLSRSPFGIIIWFLVARLGPQFAAGAGVLSSRNGTVEPGIIDFGNCPSHFSALVSSTSSGLLARAAARALIASAVASPSILVL